jgi:hypothetical protein
MTHPYRPFVEAWRALRSDVVLRATLLGSGALLAGSGPALEAFVAEIDGVVDGLQRGKTAPLEQVRHACARVSRGSRDDELLGRLVALGAVYRRTLFNARSGPTP